MSINCNDYITLESSRIYYLEMKYSNNNKKYKNTGITPKYAIVLIKIDAKNKCLMSSRFYVSFINVRDNLNKTEKNNRVDIPKCDVVD